MNKNLESGVVHNVPADLRKILVSNKKLSDNWNSLTPIARNEWICWITFFKKPETRKEHLKRAQKDLLKGKRRPCCWPGCPHRRPSAKKWL